MTESNPTPPGINLEIAYEKESFSRGSKDRCLNSVTIVLKKRLSYRPDLGTNGKSVFILLINFVLASFRASLSFSFPDIV